MKTPNDFYLERVNKAIDIDGAYGAQCWDLFAYFCKEAGYPIINCTATGFVKDIANQRATNGILNNFIDVSGQPLQDGDWCVWTDCDIAPSSHIAMFRKDNGNGTGVFFSQNQAGKQVANQANLPYAGIIGSFRPKCYLQPANKIKASGKATALYNEIRVRNVPNTKQGDTGLFYNAGMILYYDSVVEADGYIWMSYVSNSDKIRRYIAYGAIDGSSKWWNIQ